MTSPTSSSSFFSPEQFKLFHTIDRELYSLLAINLWRDPVESMQIMALWLWLERMGYTNVVKKILSLPYILINEVADEAIICLTCINNNEVAVEKSDIPIIQNLMEKEICLKYFHDNRLSATTGIAKMVNEVCIKALYDIMHQAIERNANQSLFDAQKITLSFAPPPSAGPRLPRIEFGTRSMVLPWNQENGVPAEDRSMFVTFSKGYPVQEWEVRQFFTRSYGDCIESLHMQDVELQEQALFARIVFHSADIIQVILDGLDKVKFNINGKHVWARKFVPRRPIKPSLPSVPLTFSCPHFDHVSRVEDGVIG